MSGGSTGGRWAPDCRVEAPEAEWGGVGRGRPMRGASHPEIPGLQATLGTGDRGPATVGIAPICVGGPTSVFPAFGASPTPAREGVERGLRYHPDRDFGPTGARELEPGAFAHENASWRRERMLAITAR